MTDNTVSFDAVLDDGITTPLKGITNRFKSLSAAGRNLASALAPVSNQFTQIAGAIVGIEGARRALNAAGAQAKAEQQILAALKGNSEELQRIVDLTKEIQSRAVFNDADLLASANTLLQMGVNTDNLDKALQASVETASALGLTLESTTKSFGLIESAGLAGELGERIPFLRELIAEGRSFSEITEVVLDRFGGIAEAAVSGDFGKLQIGLDSTTDILETFGNEIVTVVNPALEIFNNLLSRGAEIVSGPEFTSFLSLVAELQPLLAPILAVFAAITGGVIALKVLSITVFSLVGYVSTIVSGVLGLATSLGVIPGIIIAIATQSEIVRDAFSSIFSTVRRLIDNVAGEGISNIREAVNLLIEGKANVEDVLRIISGELRQFGGRFQISVIAPIKVGLTAIKDFAVALGEIVVTSFITSTLLAVNTVTKALSSVFSFVGVDLGLDSFTDSLENSIEQSANNTRQALEDLANAFSFEEKLKEEREGIERELAEVERATDALSSQLRARRLATLEQDLNEFTSKTSREIAALSNEFDEVLSNSFTLGNGVALDSSTIFNDLSPESISTALGLTNGQIRDDLIKAFSEAIDEIETLDKRSAVEVADLRLSLLDQVNESRIDFLESDQNTLGSIESLRERISAIQDESAAIQESITIGEELFSRLQAAGAGDAQIRQLERLTTLNDSLRNKQAEQLSVINLVAKAEEELNNLRVERALNVQDQIQVVTAIAQAESETVADAYEALTERREEVADLFSTGVLTRAGVIQAEEDAIQTFNEIAAGAEQELNNLIARFPEAAESIEILRSKLEDVKTTVNGDENSEGGFLSGALQGARATVAEFDNLTLQGEKAGSTLINSFGEGLTDVLVTSGASFKQFVADFLIQIGRLIARLLVFRALSAALSGIGGGASSAATEFTPIATDLSAINFNTGGTVPGPDVNRDIVRAMLTPGEEVVDRDTAKYYGVNFFENLRNRVVPRSPVRGSTTVNPSTFLNSGGRAVGQSASVSSGNPGIAVVVPDNQALERLLANGGEALNNFLQENGYRKEGFGN